MVRFALRHELRDLTYNPQRHLPLKGTLAELADARHRAVLRSQGLRRQPGSAPSERSGVFRQIRSLNEQMLAVRPDRAADLQRRIREVAEALQENAVAMRRDYFFGMFDEPALEGLCRALPAVAQFRI